MIQVPTNPLFHIAFDAVAWLSALAFGRVLYAWRLRPQVRDTARVVGPGYFASLAVGAVVGGYLAGSLISMVGPSPTLSHSIAGVLAGAIVAVEIYKAVRGVRRSTGAAFAGPLALGVAIGRWGCLFSGLPDNTYGSPSGLPWAVDLGDGIGRHPVQAYESVAMLAFLAVYLVALRRRRRWALAQGFYVFIGWYGAQRFLWEFLKPYPRLAWGLDLFQFIALGLVIYACVYFARDRARAGAAGPALA